MDEITEEQFMELPLSKKLEYIYKRYSFTKEEAEQFTYFVVLEDEASKMEELLGIYRNQNIDYHNTIEEQKERIKQLEKEKQEIQSNYDAFRDEIEKWLDKIEPQLEDIQTMQKFMNKAPSSKQEEV